MYMECFPAILVGLVLLWLAVLKQLDGGRVSKEYHISGHFPSTLRPCHPIASHFLQGPEEQFRAEMCLATPQWVCRNSRHKELEIANGAAENTSYVFPEVALESGRDVRP